MVTAARGTGHLLVPGLARELINIAQLESPNIALLANTNIDLLAFSDIAHQLHCSVIINVIGVSAYRLKINILSLKYLVIASETRQTAQAGAMHHLYWPDFT